MAYVFKSTHEELTDLDLSVSSATAPADPVPLPAINVVPIPAPKPKAAEVRSFDYSGFSAAVAKEAEAIAKRIRTRLRTHNIETGKELLAIKKALGHGKFGKWLEFHFGWKERTAQNYMNSATAFGSIPQVIDLLPQSTVYKLAAKSTPDEIRQSVIDEIKRGEKPDAKQIERKIAATKRNAGQTVAHNENVSPDGRQETSEICEPDNVVASHNQTLPIEVPAIASQEKDVAQSPPLPQEQELRAQKIVGYLRKRFGEKFSPLRDAILNTDLAALRKALSEA